MSPHPAKVVSSDALSQTSEAEVSTGAAALFGMLFLGINVSAAMTPEELDGTDSSRVKTSLPPRLAKPSTRLR